jgi:hypothetical protein
MERGALSRRRIRPDRRGGRKGFVEFACALLPHPCALREPDLAASSMRARRRGCRGKSRREGNEALARGAAGRRSLQPARPGGASRCGAPDGQASGSPLALATAAGAGARRHGRLLFWADPPRLDASRSIEETELSMSEGEQDARPRRGERAPAVERGREQAEASSDRSHRARRAVRGARVLEASALAAL